MRRRLISFIIALFALKAHADPSSLSFSRNARTFETQHSTLVTKGLANSCLTVPIIPDGLPCNPAMTPLNPKASLGAEIQLSNGYSGLDNVRKLLDGKITQELVDTLFSEGKIIQIEANADVSFHSKYLNGLYTPISVKGFSIVRNEANPDVDLYAIEEKGFTFQSGYEALPDFYIGAQIRAFDRKFIKQRFKLAVLGTDAGKDLLKPKEQTVTFIEPGLTYFFGKEWKPRVSLFVANTGFISEKFDELDEPVETQFGFGISPPVTWGEFDLSLEYRSMTYEETAVKKIRFGALYHFGSMYLSGGIDSNGISGGVFYSLDKINAGIVYSTTQLINQQENFYTQTVYVQLGWQI
jgi:hypothetical protein